MQVVEIPTFIILFFSNTFAKVDATTQRLQSKPIAVIPGTNISYSVQKLGSSNTWSYIDNVDADGNIINIPGKSSPELGAKYSIGYTKVENITIPNGVSYISFGVYIAGVSNGDVFSQPMLVFSQTVGDYVQGNYNNNDRLLKIEKSAENFQISIGQSVTSAQNTADSASSKIDSLQVGGRNYVKNSTGLSANDADKKPAVIDWRNTGISNANYTYDADGITMTVSNPNSEWFYSLINAWTDISATPMLPGKTYTISVDAMGTVPGVAFRLNDAWSSFNPINSSTWTRVSATFTNASNATQTYIKVNAATPNGGRNGFTAGQTLRLRNFKLEDGNLPSPWTPAPEDVDSATAKAQSTADEAKSGVSDLVDKTQWKSITTDNMDKITSQGNYFVTGDNPTNAPIQPWFYLKVDTPRSDRITQTVWKDLDSTLSYIRSFGNNTWSSWSQNVTSTTMVQLLGDNWSIGTSQATATTQKIITSINGQADGTLVVKGSSVILDAGTVFAPNFVTNLLNAQDATIGRTLTIASGGSLSSDVIHMDKDSFTVKAPNINSHRISSEGYKVFTRDGVFNISSGMGSFSTDGNISVAIDSNSQPYKRGIFHSEYGGNNLMMSATGYTNSDPDEFLNMSSARLDYMYSKTGLLSDASQHTSIRANLIETTGTLNAFGVTQTPRVYSWPNLTLESIQQSVVLKAGNQNILQVRENSYVYLLTRHSGSGGSSLQIASDGALFVQSSASKYKEDIKYDGSTSVGDKFLTLDPATWQDKDEYEQRKLYRETGIEPTHQIHMDDKRYYGLIAEDLVKAGLEEFVVRDEVTGEVNGLEYDKVAISLIPVVREQRDAINELRVEVERLKDNTK